MRPTRPTRPALSAHTDRPFQPCKTRCALDPCFFALCALAPLPLPPSAPLSLYHSMPRHPGPSSLSAPSFSARPLRNSSCHPHSPHSPFQCQTNLAACESGMRALTLNRLLCSCALLASGLTLSTRPAKCLSCATLLCQTTRSVPVSSTISPALSRPQ